jgi:signal peptidase I
MESINNTRKPVLALVLSIIPGLGQIYNGQLIKGIIILLIETIFSLFLYYSDVFMSINGFIIFISIGLGILLFRVIDAFVVAKKKKIYELKPYNKEYIYVLYILFIFSIHIIKQLTSTNTIQTFRILTGSMAPCVIPGDLLVCQTGYYNAYSLQHNDLVVFHYPAESDRSINDKTNYVTRCIGIPGDTLSISNKQVYINGIAAPNPLILKFKYKCYTNTSLSQRLCEKYQIKTYDIYMNEKIMIGSNEGYIIDISPETVVKLRDAKIFDSIVDFNLDEFEHSNSLFPF